MISPHEIQTAIQCYQSGNIEQSEEILTRYIEAYPNDLNANLLAAAIHTHNKDYQSVITYSKKILELNPGHMHALTLLADALFSLALYSDCIQFLEENTQQIQLQNNPEMALLLAKSLAATKQYERAISLFQQLALATFKEAECQHNLGIILEQMNDVPASIGAYEKAVQENPNSIASKYNLAFMLDKSGDKTRALQILHQCYLERPSANIKQGYVQILSTASLKHTNQDSIDFITRILQDDETDAQTLSTLVIAILKYQIPIISDLIKIPASDFDAFYTLYDKNKTAFMQSPLLALFYSQLPIVSYSFECFSRQLRRALLKQYQLQNKPTGTEQPPLALVAALAIRCYINGYIFTCTTEEKACIEQIIGSLSEDSQAITGYSLSILALYVSLYELNKVHQIAIDHDVIIDNTFVIDMVKLQYNDNVTEEKILTNLNVVSSAEITDETSLLVQSQYEGNPYPVWQKLSLKQVAPVMHIIQKLASDSFDPSSLPITAGSKPDILVAGCGTGSHVLQTAMRIEHNSLTAIDLSKKSLAFAIRKADELGLQHIDFKQMDILNVTGMSKQFDIIESVGVLHHMQVPLDGMKALVSILKPGGLTNFGFYSKLGRRHIIKAKTIFDNDAAYVSDDQIKLLRHDIMQDSNQELVTNIKGFKDFYSLDDCRDLIFHENENNYSLIEMDEMLKQAGLRFIGFDLYDPNVMVTFKAKFPEKDSEFNLVNWDEHEQSQPDIFSSMYAFWCQKI